MNKKKRYEFGSGVNNSSIKNYLESPMDALSKNDIAVAKALSEANSDPLYQTLELIGNATMGIGMNMMAAGGTVKGDKVEIEGNEAVELPNGKTTKVKGPSHEQGGIDMFLPEGSEVFSDRITIDGITMADRKMQREKQSKKLKSMLDRNPVDKISKNTYERQMSAIESEEQADLELQGIIGSLMGAPQKAEFGFSNNSTGHFTDALDELFNVLNNPDVLEATKDQFNPADLGSVQINNKKPGLFSNIDLSNVNVLGEDGESSIGFGDLLSIGGDIYSTFAPMVNTLRNRAKDTPNENYFEDFGVDALESLDQAKGYVEQQKDNAISDINLDATTSKKASRNKARGVNTQRAFDLAIDQQAGRNKTDVYDNVAQQMMQLLTQEAGLENQQDYTVMQGEQQKDLANRQDKDNFNTQMAKNITGIGQGLQETGKDINAITQRNIMQNLVNQLSSYGFKIDKKGNITQ